MPSPQFFQNLGLFVRDGFFDAATCASLCSEMRRAGSEKALISGKDVDLLDEDFRRVLRAKLEASITNMVSEAILVLKPSLEDHFRVSLQSSEKPVFLRYEEGAFYRPHVDGWGHNNDRRISIVIFLNGRSEEPSPNTFGGGDLTFYGLLDGPQWEKCAFALDAEEGLLIAFRSNTMHEVRPVTFGQRFTVATWFS